MFDGSSRLEQEAEAYVTQPRGEATTSFLEALCNREICIAQRGPAKGTPHAIFSLLLCNRLVETVSFTVECKGTVQQHV